jgi:hypothetical protein
VDECDFELSSGSSTSGLWLVNGADHTGGASASYTNRITVKGCQFNGGGVGIGIMDDGGVSHHFSDNNFNNLDTDIRVANVNGLVIDGENEFEGETTTAISFAATKKSGTAVSATSNAVIVGNVFSNSGAINLITYVASALTAQFMCGNLFINNNAGGSPTTGLTNVTSHFGFANTQGGTGISTNQALGNFLGGAGAGGVALRVGAKTTLAATETGLWNNESPVTRFYVGDGSGFSVAFAKRTGSVTTDLVTFNDTGTVAAFTGNVSATGALMPAGKVFPGTDASAAQTAAGLMAGTGVPNNANGNNGDFYFRSDGGAGTSVYMRRAGAWVGVV